MRIDIVIDDSLMAQAQSLTGFSTKKGVIEEALKLLIQIRRQAKIRELRGQLNWEGNVDDMRADE